VEHKQRFTLSETGVIKPQILEKKRETRESRDFFYFLLGSVGEIGFAVALPIIAGALLGKFIDTEYHWYPKATLSGLVGGVFISFVGLIGTVQSVVRRSDEMKRTCDKEKNVKCKIL
jgi:hypothetical protein